MKKHYIFYRVECNYGSKYFDFEEAARRYYLRKVEQDVDVELWGVHYTYDPRSRMLNAEQHLLSFSDKRAD
jgi:hypothetical protein